MLPLYYVYAIFWYPLYFLYCHVPIFHFLTNTCVCVCVCEKNPLLRFFICSGVVIYVTPAGSILDPFTCKHKAYNYMKCSIIVWFKMHTQPRILWIPGSFPGLNREKREVEHWSPSNAGVKNGRRHISTPYVTSCSPQGQIQLYLLKWTE